MPRRGLLLGVMVVAFFVVVLTTQPATGGDCVRPGQPGGKAGKTLAALGEMALERLPWDVTIVRANLGSRHPVAVSACYLMQDDLLVVTQTGMVYCLARRDLNPRWVTALEAPLGAIPAEGPDHYAFLTKAADGSYWADAMTKRAGARPARYPVRLPYAASGGVDADASRIYVASLGSPRNNKTLESVSLVDAKRGWGWRTRGLLWASPVVDPSGNSLVIAGEDGTVTSLPTGEAPAATNWSVRLTGAVTVTPSVTPAHVVVGSHEGVLRCLDLGDGQVRWFQGLDAPIRTAPWVLGRTETVNRSSGVEGAPEVMVDTYVGIAFARNRNGLFAFDLDTGKKLFHETAGRRPICREGKYVVTIDEGRILRFHDASTEYGVEGKLRLSMFDLVPTNTSDGAIYGCTHDGGVVAAIPKMR